MILKELRISRHFSQEQLAQMSGLSVRTIHRIESGHNASLESLKCLASVLEVDVSTLNQEKFMIDKNADNWRRLPLSVKWWFFLNCGSFHPMANRNAFRRAIIASHVSGFIFCALGFVNQVALVGGLIMLCNAYIFHSMIWQGDKYSIWYDAEEIKTPELQRL